MSFIDKKINWKLIHLNRLTSFCLRNDAKPDWIISPQAVGATSVSHDLITEGVFEVALRFVTRKSLLLLLLLCFFPFFSLILFNLHINTEGDVEICRNSMWSQAKCVLYYAAISFIDVAFVYSVLSQPSACGNKCSGSSWTFLKGGPWNFLTLGPLNCCSWVTHGKNLLTEEKF